jgi:peptidyl-prolyl cis-trans isomerase A (cyclophilin A)
MAKTALTKLLFVALAVLIVLPAVASEDLMKPESLNEQSPDSYHVKFETSKGDIIVTVTRDWAPIGADRFYNLVKNGYYDDVRFFRVVPNFVVQFGMSGDPELTKIWQNAKIKDDSVTQSNKPGSITFATAGPNSRTTQVFINLRDNSGLDDRGFSPFGVVSEGMEVVTQLYSGYGDSRPNGPQQQMITMQGNAYLDEKFPQLDRIVKATIAEGGPASEVTTAEE